MKMKLGLKLKQLLDLIVSLDVLCALYKLRRGQSVGELRIHFEEFVKRLFVEISALVFVFYVLIAKYVLCFKVLGVLNEYAVIVYKLSQRRTDAAPGAPIIFAEDLSVILCVCLGNVFCYVPGYCKT